MTNTQAERNIRLCRLHIIFSESLFLGIITMSLFMGLAHMSVPEIFYMQACMMALAAVLEIPTGTLSDIIGRKRTIVIARIFHAVGSLWIMFMSDPLDAWMSAFFWTIGLTLQSGADTSLLYETLQEQGDADERFTRILGSVIGWRLKIKACLALSLGVIATIDLRMPLYIGMPLTLIPLVCSFFYTEPTRTKHHKNTKAVIADIVVGVIAVQKSPSVRWIVGFGTIIGISTSVWYWHNPYYTLVGIPLAWLGVIGFSTNMTMALGSRYAYVIERKLGERVSVLALAAAYAFPILLMGLVPSMWSASSILLQSAASGFIKPFTQNYLNSRISNDVRNTVLSIQSTFENLVGIFALAAFGLLDETAGLLNTIIVLGFTMLLLGGLGYRAYTKLPSSD